MISFSVIAAATRKGSIGYLGSLPWPRIPSDIKHFRNVTRDAPEHKANVVIMGRKTWESIPDKNRPLKGRINIIVSTTLESHSSKDSDQSYFVVKSLNDAQMILKDNQHHEVFVVGGGQLYKEALDSPLCKRVYMTQILKEVDNVDVWMPTVDNSKFRLESEGDVKIENGVSFQFLVYERIQDVAMDLKTRPSVHEEYQYLDIVKRIITEGNRRSDRRSDAVLVT